MQTSRLVSARPRGRGPYGKCDSCSISIPKLAAMLKNAPVPHAIMVK